MNGGEAERVTGHENSIRSYQLSPDGKSIAFTSRDGKTRVRRRKLVPTYTERMIWGRGDGSTLGVLDTPVGPPGVTVRHLLAHAGGLAPDQRRLMTEPGGRRIYSNAGFAIAGAAMAGGRPRSHRRKRNVLSFKMTNLHVKKS